MLQRVSVSPRMRGLYQAGSEARCECSGIDGARLEKLEQRLKAEVLAEARGNAGRVHVLREEMQTWVRFVAGAAFGCFVAGVPHGLGS